MKYSFNGDRSKLVFGRLSNTNASYKDLSAVCSAIRYKAYYDARSVLESIAAGHPIIYRKYNSGMGSRHELGGRKGRTPQKCGKIVTKVLTNAVNNAKNKGFGEDELYVVHASANKMSIYPRRPPKGRQQGTAFGMYGFNSQAHSNLEWAKVEIGVSAEYKELGLSKSSIKMIERNRKRAQGRTMMQSEGEHTKKKAKAKRHPLQKGSVKPKTADDQSMEEAKKEKAADVAGAVKDAKEIRETGTRPVKQ